MRKSIVLGVTALSAIATTAIMSATAQADIVVGPVLPVVGQLIRIVLKAPIDLNWI